MGVCLLKGSFCINNYTIIHVRHTENSEFKNNINT